MKRHGEEETRAGSPRLTTDWFLSLFGVTRRELPLVVLSALHFFFLLAGYYIMRSIRDAVGLTGGIHDLKRLFFVTLVVMVLANPPLAALVSRLPRRLFIPIVYVVFILNLLLFHGMFYLRGIGGDINVARAFFVWVSVFNLFAVSLFWGLMADLFQAEQGRRLFGLISVGGTFGAIAGSASTVFLARKLGTTNLLPLSVLLLCAACICAVATNRLDSAGLRPSRTGMPGGPSLSDRRIGGGIFSGLTHLFMSPYLLGISVYIFFHAFSGTLAYFLQGTIVETALTTRDARTQFFATIDLNVNCLAVLFQIFLTGRIIRYVGVGPTLALIPTVVLAGFALLGYWPSLVMLYVFQVVRRATNFALARPAREALFTVVPREDKFKAKNLIDTVAYRGGDAAGVTWFSLLTSKLFGLAVTQVLWCFFPLALLWGTVSYWLGRYHHRQSTLLRPPACHQPLAARDR